MSVANKFVIGVQSGIGTRYKGRFWRLAKPKLSPYRIFGRTPAESRGLCGLYPKSMLFHFGLRIARPKG